MNEQNFGKGAVQDKHDGRDFQWEEIGFGSLPFDWSQGYDIESIVGKLTLKNQNGSGSCGGQAWSYLGQVLDYASGEKSAKFIYAQTHVMPAGSAGRDNCNLVIKKGWGTEALTTSYDSGNPPQEAFMQKVSDITPEAFTEALTDRALSYAQVSLNIDTLAQAMRDNKGVIIGITGQNNGTWMTKFPKPPTQGEWNHWVYCGKALTINGKKYIGFVNSWGNIGENGWQYISEEYMPWLFSAWTLVLNAIPPEAFHHHFTPTLRYGQSNEEIKALQTALSLQGFFPVTPTGYFGSVTFGAVKKFQTKHGLTSDGICGKNTCAKLNEIYD